MTNVFIIGSKGIPASYGGFETFVDCLTREKKSKDIKYHVACMSDKDSEFEYNNARCFNVPVRNIGSAKAVVYDLKSLDACITYIEKNKLKNCIIYILACRIGPFMFLFRQRLKRFNIKLYTNPDGHEWLRGKWNKAIRKYWKYSEKLMVKHSDLLVCDSKGIEEYIKRQYGAYKPYTVFIAYGASVVETGDISNNSELEQWFGKHSVRPEEYYLIVGRFVPENNFETIIREFMASDTKKDLVIVTNVEKNKFYENLLQKTNFIEDKRIKFVGTVYDRVLLKKIRESAYAYIHGHEVGGTNPSLLEALATTKVNILLDVVFNIEVGQKAALYFNKETNRLKAVIEEADRLDSKQIEAFGSDSKRRIEDDYTWEKIVLEYEKLFTAGRLQ